MLAGDRASTGLGIHVVEASNGSAVATLTVAEHHCNGLDVCHGGFIFTLADTAMAFASNSHGPMALAATASVEFLRPARTGAVLRAHATETARAGKTAVYTVTVTDDAGETIATFHGRTKQRSTQT